MSSGVIHTGLSYHSRVYVSWGRAVKLTHNFHKYKVNWIYRNFDSEEFLKDLGNLQWCQVTNLNDDDETLASRLDSLFLQIWNKHAPLNRKKKSYYKPRLGLLPVLWKWFMSVIM